MIRTVEHDGLVLHLRDEGPRSGEAAVLLHGFPQDSTCWADVTPLLHSNGLRTLAPDQRGYSTLASPRDVSAYRLERLAGDVLAILDASNVTRAHIVGHDWGGALAWHLGSRHPDRVATLTVLSTPHPRALARAMTCSLQPLRSWYTLAVQVPVMPEVLLARSLAATLRLSGMPADIAGRYAARLSRPSDLRAPLAWYRAVAWRPPWEVLSALAIPGTVTVPTTYLWGSHDPALGRAAAHMTEDYVSGDYRFIEIEAGHWLPELHPGPVADAIVSRVRRARGTNSSLDRTPNSRRDPRQVSRGLSIRTPRSPAWPDPR